MTAGKHTPYFECLEALQAAGCPICSLARRSVALQLEALIYESVNDPLLREELLSTRGFCRTHAWELRRRGGALGIAIIYRDIVREAVRNLTDVDYGDTKPLLTRSVFKILEGSRESETAEKIVQSLSPEADCPACRKQRQVEAMYLDILLENIEDEKMREALRLNDGLCLPHFCLATSRAQDRKTLKLLVASTRSSLARLLEDLDEMIRRHDYRFSDEGLDDVGDAWIRAIARVSGGEGIACS